MIPKFRAWDKDAECMIYQKDNGDEYVWQIGTEDIWIEPIHGMTIPRQVLMQSTGLKDKNGVDVYQGDIIKCTSGCPHEVIWLEEYGGTFIGGMPAWYLSGLNNCYSWTGREEVIGNIWEDGELLSDSKRTEEN